MKISKKFYSFFELADRWNILPCDLLHLAAAGEISLSITWNGPVFISQDEDHVKESFLSNTFVKLLPADVQEFIIAGCGGIPTDKKGQQRRLSQFTVYVSHAFLESGEEVQLIASSSGGGNRGCRTVRGPNVDISNIFILSDEVNRYEEAHQQSPKDSPPGRISEEEKAETSCDNPPDNHADEVEYPGADNICAAFASRGVERTWKHIRTSYKRQGLKIQYRHNGKKKSPYLTRRDLDDFIYNILKKK